MTTEQLKPYALAPWLRQLMAVLEIERAMSEVAEQLERHRQASPYGPSPVEGVATMNRILRDMGINPHEDLGPCRVCGCTEGNACTVTIPGGELVAFPGMEKMGTMPCWWIQPGLCSGCAS